MSRRYISKNQTSTWKKRRRARDMSAHVDRQRLKVFISHNWDEHHHHYLWILSQLADSPTYAITDLSVSKEIALIAGAKEARGKIETKIATSDVFFLICEAGQPFTDWMKFEIDNAKKYLLPIIEVRADDTSDPIMGDWPADLTMDVARDDPTVAVYKLRTKLGLRRRRPTPLG